MSFCSRRFLFGGYTACVVAWTVSNVQSDSVACGVEGLSMRLKPNDKEEKKDDEMAKIQKKRRRTKSIKNGLGVHEPGKKRKKTNAEQKPVINEEPVENEVPVINEEPVENEVPVINEEPAENEEPVENEVPSDLVREHEAPSDLIQSNRVYNVCIDKLTEFYADEKPRRISDYMLIDNDGRVIDDGSLGGIAEPSSNLEGIIAEPSYNLGGIIAEPSFNLGDIGQPSPNIMLIPNYNPLSQLPPINNINTTESIQQRVIVFDWDDTLFPTKYLGRNYRDGNAYSAEDQRKLQEIDEAAKNAIEQAKAVAERVQVISNGSFVWLAESLRHMPKTCRSLNNGTECEHYVGEDGIERSFVPEPAVISSRSVVLDASNNECQNHAYVQEWKSYTFDQYAKTLMTPDVRQKFEGQLISVGDDWNEMIAMVRTKEKLFPNASVKLITMVLEPSMEELLAQLQQLSGSSGARLFTDRGPQIVSKLHSDAYEPRTFPKHLVRDAIINGSIKNTESTQQIIDAHFGTE